MTILRNNFVTDLSTTYYNDVIVPLAWVFESPNSSLGLNKYEALLKCDAVFYLHLF